ncbi:MAG: thiamine pyrophosphate-dependent dehydrogenase E1 component subunit alpha [Anaerolineae bacterium]|nr:thiamine pyrophosphate-dependent dehydrogenase E1 component subunit alpha [Anaerolineae bacterium]
MELDSAKLLDMYYKMLLIRYFEIEVMKLFYEGHIRGSTHVYLGQEATAVGACAALEEKDLITSTHRGHGHCIAKGGDPKKMMAEVLGRVTGYCKGKGGSMHIADFSKGMLGANGVVGGGIPIAVGAALASQYLNTGQIVLCFFGDGALNQGSFHEAANLAAIWKLPIVFLCENNLYALSTRVDYAFAISDLSQRALAYGFPGISVDGNDVLAVYEVVSQAAQRARKGEGPTLVVANSYRWEGHMVGDPMVYRTKEEVEQWKKKDPVKCFEKYLLDKGLLDEKEKERMHEETKKIIQEARDFALRSPEPPLEALYEDLYV